MLVKILHLRFSSEMSIVEPNRMPIFLQALMYCLCKSKGIVHEHNPYDNKEVWTISDAMIDTTKGII